MPLRVPTSRKWQDEAYVGLGAAVGTALVPIKSPKETGLGTCSRGVQTWRAYYFRTPSHARPTRVTLVDTGGGCRP